MVQYTKDEILQFISKIKNPDELIKGCKKFYEIEPRDLAYVIARKTIVENSDSEWHLLGGVKILLLIWNAVYYQRLNEEIKKDVENEILIALRNTKNDFSSLSKEKLETINLNNRSVFEKIKKIFISFARHKSIGITGASKAIHLINPQLFMMWDNEIRKNYHRYHRSLTNSESYERHSCSNKPDDAAKCYIEFMRTMQDIAKDILKQKSAEDLWRTHPSYSLEPQFISAFQQISKRELTKMLDECNYVKFRRGIDF